MIPNDDDLALDLDLDEDPPERDEFQVFNVIFYDCPHFFAVINEASRTISGPAEGLMGSFTRRGNDEEDDAEGVSDSIKRNLLAWQKQCADKTLSRFGAFEFVHILLASSFLFLHTALQ